MVNFALNNNQQSLIKSIRLLAPQLAQKEMEIDQHRSEAFDCSLVNELAKLNLLNPMVPPEFGGRGLNYFDYALLMEEIGAVSPGLAAVMIFNCHFISILDSIGTEEQKAQYLPVFTQQQPKLAAMALSEKNAGSDAGNMSTLAVKKNDHYLISGIKEYVTNGTNADYIVCFATLDPTRARSQMLALLVPGNAPGIRQGQLRKTMGIRYAHCTELIFDNVSVPAANLLGEEGNGYMIITQAIDRDKVLTGAIGVGIARAAFDMALAFAKDRKQFGRTIYENQAIAFELSKMAAQIEAARMVVWKASWLLDNNEDFTVAASIAKITGTTTAEEVVSKAMDIVGGRAYLEGHPLEKLYRDVKIFSNLEGTNHIQNAIITSLL
ncbi:MAG TPA: acyl-CoA dehydrogenase family protein [Syntrophomonas sp.]|nr:acyl-CoA dehydrogenase family protein [Syntrophomonas sp.]HRW11626.1 acyl-CoA dehydrogenase family protein [Syntrophomonas sp.]